MQKSMTIALGLLILSFAVFAKTTVNKSIHIGEGESYDSGCTSVNGSIVVDEGAEINGGCKTVNGSIKIARDCSVRHLQSVNGSIRVGEETDIRSDIETVNGSVHCDKGVYIDGSINTINGSIDLQGTEIEERITTYNGNITLAQNCIVRDDIIVKDSKGHNNRREPLRIIIDNSVVEGDVVNKEEDIEVIVYLRNGGRVKGDIYDAEVEED